MSQRNSKLLIDFVDQLYNRVGFSKKIIATIKSRFYFQYCVSDFKNLRQLLDKFDPGKKGNIKLSTILLD